MLRAYDRPYCSTIGASSVGVAPWRITPSAPSENCERTVATHDAAEPEAAGASHSSGINVAMCSSCSVVGEPVDRFAFEADDHRIGSEPLQNGWVPSVGADEQVAIGSEVGGEAADGLLQSQRLGDVVANRGQA